MCVPGMQTFPEKPTPMFGLTLQSGAPRAPRQDTSHLFSPGSPFYYKPSDANAVTTPSSIPPSSASSAMPAYVDAQQPMGQQQVQPASMPRATTGRFSFNNGNFRIGDSTMNSSDAGLNI